MSLPAGISLLILSLLGACSQPELPASDRLYRQGMTYFHAGRWDLAAQSFRQALQAAPDSSSAQIRLGMVYLHQGRPSAAQAQLDGLSPLHRQRPEGQILQAQLHAFTGRALQARDLAEAVLARHPNSLDARLLLAQLGLQAASTMDLSRTQDLCGQVLDEVPGHQPAGLMILQATLRSGAYQAALALADQLDDPGTTDYRIPLLGGTAALWARAPQAIPLLRQAVDRSIERHTERLKALWLLHLAYKQNGGYPDHLESRYRFHTFQGRPAASPRLVDVASQTGVGKVDRGRGNAWLDVDLDGDPDLFSVGIQTANALYRNDGGHFTDITAAWGLDDQRGGWSATAADFDNDGDADLFVTRDAWEGTGPNSLYRNDGDRFTDMAAVAGLPPDQASFTATWGDYNLDGYLDLYVANGVIGDGDKNNLLLNRKNGTFIDIAETAGVADTNRTIGTAFGDYNSDGYPDLYVVNNGQANRLYANSKTGAFTDRARGAGVEFPVEGGYVAFFFDYDNDGQLDLFASTMSAFEDVLNSLVEGRANEPNRPFLYRNEGDGTFTDMTRPAGLARSFGSMGIGVGDLDNDGYPDIYLSNGGPEMYRLEANTLFINRRDGTFADVSAASGTDNLGKGHGATFADFDSDGDLDLYVGLGGHYDADIWPNSLYRNDGPTGHFLQVRLIGTTSNRDAIGARVQLQSGPHRVYTEVARGYGFGSNNAPLLQLGLGPRQVVDRLEVRWPSGLVQHWEDLPADRLIDLTEGRDSYR
ncbi:MAG: tetratricopeptide repeat protein [Candidatus Latescibacteria bacterium]|nr:tetratricopeptide repeat protein [Candidatus Latescibacterota bacterium]